MIRCPSDPKDSAESGRWLAGKNVGSVALVFHFRVRLALDDLLHDESFGFETELDFWRLKEKEVHRDLLVPQLVHVNNLVACMKCEQQEATWPQYPLHFPEDQGQTLCGEVHSGVESSDSGQRAIRNVQAQHVSLPKGDIRVKLSSLLQHARRQIQPKNRSARITQVTRYVTGAAPHVTHFASSSDLCGKAVEQLLI